ncbi:MAG: hypothetical protein H7Y17_08375, partial [Chlorobia bacterium]|nr:hypothetical protein [Fimbriimonadaceae bacterium]
MIDRLNDVAHTWAGLILHASWQAGLLAILAWLLCRVWKRMPPSVASTIWTIVCLKFILGLIPLGIPIPILPATPVQATPVESLPVSSFASQAPAKVAAVSSISVEAILFLMWLG